MRTGIMRTRIKWTEIKRTGTTWAEIMRTGIKSTGIMWMGITRTAIARKMVLVLAGAVLLAGCDDHDTILVPVAGPAPPVGLEAGYYNRAVTLYWNLAAGWDGETFLVFGKRVEDNSFFLIADVTSCSEGSCEYTDTNIVAAVTYDYYVAALDSRTGLETDSDRTVRVAVPTFAPPPVPTDLEVVALDATNYIRWNDDARAASDFSAYRVYLLADGGGFPTLLGESDSPGFLDALAENGLTYRYAVSSVDVYGHESGNSFGAQGTPRPDFTGELIYSFVDDPALSGFRFSESDQLDPIVPGASPERHFRLETDASGWWLVPGPSASVVPQGVFTTQLKCGVAADAQCLDWTTAPMSGYSSADIAVDPELTYVWRVVDGAGLVRFGAIRVSLLGADQTGASLMIFDWAYQLQEGNPQLILK